MQYTVHTNYTPTPESQGPGATMQGVPLVAINEVLVENQLAVSVTVEH